MQLNTLILQWHIHFTFICAREFTLDKQIYRLLLAEHQIRANQPGAEVHAKKEHNKTNDSNKVSQIIIIIIIVTVIACKRSLQRRRKCVIFFVAHRIYFRATDPPIDDDRPSIVHPPLKRLRLELTAHQQNSQYFFVDLTGSAKTAQERSEMNFCP